MPMTDVTLAKRLVNSRATLKSYADRKAKAEEFLAGYDRTVAELTAEADHLEKVATGRDLSEDRIAELGATTARSKSTETTDPIVPDGEAATSGV